MKTKKIVTVLLAALLFTATFILPVTAAMASTSADELKGAQNYCPGCGRYSLTSRTYLYETINDFTKNCSHYAHGYDHYKRDIYATESNCPACGYANKSASAKDTFLWCGGYN